MYVVGAVKGTRSLSSVVFRRIRSNALHIHANSTRRCAEAYTQRGVEDMTMDIATQNKRTGLRTLSITEHGRRSAESCDCEVRQESMARLTFYSLEQEFLSLLLQGTHFVLAGSEDTKTMQGSVVRVVGPVHQENRVVKGAQ